MIFALTLSLLCQQATAPNVPATARIDLVCAAMRLKDVVEEISKQLHVRLEAGPPVGDQIFTLSLQKAPAQEALARIAEAAGAEWRQVQGIAMLIRSDGLAQAQQDRAVAEKASTIRHAIDKLRGKAAKLPSWSDGAAIEYANARIEAANSSSATPNFEVLQTAIGRGPVGRLVQRVASSFSAEDLAVLGRPGRRRAGCGRGCCRRRWGWPTGAPRCTGGWAR